MKSKWAYAVAILVAAVVIGGGLSRFGIWQPAELHMADLARGDQVGRETESRPPAQISAIRMGFRFLGATESGGRLPSALMAIAATIALAFAVGRATDRRTGAFVGIAYATMPLVYLNARQMFGGGIAQSGATLLFSALVFVLWGRPPRGVRDDHGYDKPQGTAVTQADTEDPDGGATARSADPVVDTLTKHWPRIRWVLASAIAAATAVFAMVAMRVASGSMRASWLPGATVATAVAALALFAFWSAHSSEAAAPPAGTEDLDRIPEGKPESPFRKAEGAEVPDTSVEILRDVDETASGVSSLAGLWTYGRWLLLGVVALAATGAGWMLGVLPALLGVGLALLLRWRVDRGASRWAALAITGTGIAVAAMCVRWALATHESYVAWTGAGPESHPPGQSPTYEAFIEQIGHGTFPWTGLLIFGIVRLLMPPPTREGKFGATAILVDEAAAMRESGVRLAALLTAGFAFGLQSFHLQNFGMTPFIGVAPLAVAIGIALRDAEREARPWRLITAVGTLITIVMMRDYLLFPKSSYSALGLADGGPSFPTGFTGTLKDWFKAQGGRFVLAFARGNAPGEVFFFMEAMLFVIVGWSAVFQGAGDVKPIAWLRPYVWMKDVESYARAALAREVEGTSRRFAFVRHVTGFGILANFRIWSAAGAVALMAVFGVNAQTSRTLTTPVRMIFRGIAALPLVIVVGVYSIVLLWNLFAWVGRPRRGLMKVLGTRVALAPFAAVCVALMVTQMYIPALSEHLSPRGVWAVIRQVRRGDEPVARFGGNQNDRATRYYANFEVRDLFGEPEAVDWLMNRNPRHFMVVGADVFPSLNRAYRSQLPQAQRRNIPVIDATNSNLYVAASTPGSGGNRNPLDAFVHTRDARDRDEPGMRFHPHGRYEGSTFIREPAVLNDSLEYLGFNLDSGGQSFVPVGGTFTITYHFHVLREIYGNYQIFIHIDGQCPRINGDHDPVGGRYPVRYWLQGDYIHDQHRITIPGYCRAGRYTVFLGFFQGDDRMRVTGGDHDRENRVVAARIVVR